MITTAIVLTAALAGAAVIGNHVAGRHHPRGPVRRVSEPGRAPRSPLPSALVAWFDGDGTLRIGNVASLAQRPLAQVANPPCCTLVTAGHRIYWAGLFKGRDYIQAYDLATGRIIRHVAEGSAVVASGDARTIYITRSDNHLVALSADGRGPVRQLVMPPGWQVLGPPLAAADGIVLSTGARRPAIGVWRPGDGNIRVIGHGYVMAAWSSSTGRRGLIAWVSARCSKPPCPVKITDTSTGRTKSVHGPPNYGFIGEGGDTAFSVGGGMLAAFVNKLKPVPTAGFKVALVNTTTGAVHLVRGTKLAGAEMSGWLVWLTGSGYLLAGPANTGPTDSSQYAGYAIDARTATARPFTFFPAATYKYPDSPVYDITFGAVLLPRSAAPPRR